jgi:hypothetical protein
VKRKSSLARTAGRGKIQGTIATRSEVMIHRQSILSPARRLPLMRFTLRRMMTAVAATAILIWLYKIAPRLADLLDDSFYPATNSITKTWDAGPAPKIDVDLYGGYISVVQSTDGRVSAVITTSAIFKNSQSGADAAVSGIAISADDEGNTIHIRATNPRKLQAFNLQTDVALRVPPGASLDLVTGHGYVHIGQCLPSPSGGRWMSSPVALKSIKARDLGNVFTGMEAEILSDPAGAATVVDLESRRGSIRIKGNDLLIKAKADQGGIEFTGRLAAGLHSFATGPFAEHADAGWRLAKGIKLVVPPDMAFTVDAVSARDQVRSEFPLSSSAPGKQGAATGTGGADSKIKMLLRSDDGPIEIFKDPGGALAPG